ncbi:MAG: hypothetical protein Q4D96_01905 [Propionibacteriaceae bacterium]|nr:hypothetical protein [Propionibacteriaceae bacterium]
MPSPLSFTPPAPDATPKSFLATPQWPSIPIQTQIKALHREHLCAAIPRDDEHSYPVVVNVTGPATRVVRSDGNGTFSTREVELDFLAEHLDPTVEHPDLGPPLQTGPVIMGDDHAYLIVIQPIRGLGAAHLLKITLNDGTVAASALLNEQVKASLPDEISLSFSADATSLLVADVVGSSRSADFIGLRLDVTDLSIQFDAHSLITGTDDITVAGEALKATTATHDKGLVLLADGRDIPAPGADVLVLGQWCYYSTGLAPVMLRDLTTGTETPVLDLPWKELHQLRQRNFLAVWSRSAYRMIAHHDEKPKRFSVWLPGESSPVLQWKENEHPIPFRSAALGETLYSSDSANFLTVRSLSSGENLGSIPWHGSSEFAVSAWGAATTNLFFPATEWF